MSIPNLVLYHDVSDAPTPFESGLGVTTPTETFARHMTHFQERFDVIDLETLLHGPMPRRPLLVTFDDCYRSVLDAARNVLAPRGIPAVLFANPDLLAPAPPSLDALLSWHSQMHGLPALRRRLELPEDLADLAAVITGPVATWSAAKREHVRARLLEEDGPGDDAIAARSPTLSAADLAALPELGVEIANHTATHVHCRALTDAERMDEVIGSKWRLEAICGRPVRAFSVPYGHERDLTPEMIKTLRASGHEAIFLVHARSNRFRKSSDIWYRVSLHDEPVETLFRKIRILPLLRSLRRGLRP